jgi:hypothetical protein
MLRCVGVNRQSARLAGADDALLWLVEPEQRQRLLVRCGTGRFAASAGRSLHRGEGLAGQAWRGCVGDGADQADRLVPGPRPGEPGW